MAIMGSRHATIVVEPRLLFREALKSLMADNVYHIVSDFASSAEIGASTMSNEPKLVVLGAQFADSALTEAVAIRKLLPKSKIVLLYESVSPPDFQKVRQSQIDGCVSSSVSFETLVSTLDLIMAGDVRTIVLHNVKRPVIQ
jgi:two-component system, NarL family, nitrate/nitrite response regulator NarL